MTRFSIDDILCLNDEQIAAFVDGGLGELEQRIVEAHLSICDDCRELVAAAVHREQDANGEEVS